MAILNQRWPTDLQPASCKFSRIRNDQMQISPVSRQAKMLRMGRPLWQAECTWVLRSHRELAKLRWWLEGLDGYAGSVQIWDFKSPRPLYENAPTHWADGATVTLAANAALGATSLQLSGLEASKIAVVQGQYVQVGNRLYLANADVTADGAGLATISINPGLLAAATAGAAIRLSQAACEMRLEEQNWPQDGAYGTTVTVSARFVETADDATAVSSVYGFTTQSGTGIGDILAWSGNQWVPLARGADGLFLKSDDGAALKLSYAAAGGGGSNLLINGDFGINQRVFGGGALAAGVYGHDRWKADAGGANYSVAASVVTLTSGTLVQVVEKAFWAVANFASTTFTISVDTPSADLTITFGSVSGTITAGSGRRSVTLTTGAGDTGNLSLKLAKATAGSVTFARVKLEYGIAATDWAPRPLPVELLLSFRYFWKSIPYATALTDGGHSDTYTGWFLQTTRIDSQKLMFPVAMRASPTVDIITSNKVAGAAADTWQWFDPTVPVWAVGTAGTFAVGSDQGMTVRIFFAAPPAGIAQGAAVIVAGGIACDAEL